MPAAVDYRDSHLGRGEDYDRAMRDGSFDTYMAEREREMLPAVVAGLFPSGVPRYVDFACGTGRVTEVVAPLAKQSYGVDVSASMVEQARKKSPATTFLIHDVTRDGPPVRDADLVTAFRFFGNAQDELRRAVLRAMNAMLKDGGYLVINDHRNPASIQSRLQHLRGVDYGMDLTYGKMRRLLDEAGFQVERSIGIGLWFVRASLNRPGVMRSRAVRLLEPLSRLPMANRLCPDMLIVARKVRGV